VRNTVLRKNVISILLIILLLLLVSCGTEGGEQPTACRHVESGWITTATPTCSDEGSHYKKCTKCGKVTKTEEIAINPDNHTSTYTEKENIVDASICIDGHYDLVEYCSDCGDTVSIKTVTLPAQHKYNGTTCSYCGKVKE